MRWFRVGGGWRWSSMWLLALALAVRIATPAGWMFAPSDGHGLPQLVICTGHGPEPLAPAVGKSGQPANAPDKSSDHPCVFAGHGAPTPPALIAATVPAPVVTSVGLSPTRLADQRPGRGLAAPPPPSQGPPTASI